MVLERDHIDVLKSGRQEGRKAIYILFSHTESGKLVVNK